MLAFVVKEWTLFNSLCNAKHYHIHSGRWTCNRKFDDHDNLLLAFDHRVRMTKGGLAENGGLKNIKNGVQIVG
uniref:Uncharacterized protein n=1 Tax=Romanomermis culicivorax TaxID=13658 RepID=A0A915J9E4_ROMCU